MDICLRATNIVVSDIFLWNNVLYCHRQYIIRTLFPKKIRNHVIRGTHSIIAIRSIFTKNLGSINQYKEIIHHTITLDDTVPLWYHFCFLIAILQRAMRNLKSKLKECTRRKKWTYNDKTQDIQNVLLKKYQFRFLFLKCKDTMIQF